MLLSRQQTVSMELCRFFLLLLGTLLGTLASPLPAQGGGRLWTVEDWQGYPDNGGLTMRMPALMKRSKDQQFHGLMGRSAGSPHSFRLGRKRNKGEMFVGLMGRRSSEATYQDIDEDWQPENY